MKIINVPIKNNEYQINIGKGLIKGVSKYLDTKRNYIIITDSNIPKEYIADISSKINIKGTVVFPPGESTKSFENAEKGVNELHKLQANKDIVLIALGGGVIGDLTGFIASIYLRGVDFVQIPTSLLAQVDSSIGGKVAINTQYMKNGVGNFKQPLCVLIDPNTLETLPKRHYNNGMGEVIKHALIDGKELYKGLIGNEYYPIEEIIYQSILIKREIVLKDVFDNNIRNILNFGHTIGHAIEQQSNYEILHGEAISIGMYLMSKNTSYRDTLELLLNKFSLPKSYDYSVDSLMKFIVLDKKIVNNQINKITIKEPGNPLIERVKIGSIKEYL